MYDFHTYFQFWAQGIHYFLFVKSHPSTCEKSEPWLKCFSMIGFPPITNQTISFLQKLKCNSSLHLFTNLVENGVCFKPSKQFKWGLGRMGSECGTVAGMKLKILNIHVVCRLQKDAWTNHSSPRFLHLLTKPSFSNALSDIAI